jgi:Cu-Zn family superoxide dismutase
MTVDANGNGALEMTVQGWTIGGAADSDILNKAVIIHDGADDFTSQPSGAAGNRIACGVIQKKQMSENF